MNQTFSKPPFKTSYNRCHRILLARLIKEALGVRDAMEALQKRLADNLARIDDELCELRSRHDRDAATTAATAALSATEQQQVGLLQVCVCMVGQTVRTSRRLEAASCVAPFGGRGGGGGRGCTHLLSVGPMTMVVSTPSRPQRRSGDACQSSPELWVQDS